MFLFLVFRGSARCSWLEMACHFCGEPVNITQLHFIIWSRDRHGIVVQLRYHIVCWNLHAYINHIEWVN
jgi:hypothetical protein